MKLTHASVYPPDYYLHTYREPIKAGVWWAWSAGFVRVWEVSRFWQGIWRRV